MPRFYACDHCGRSGAVMGVYYPDRDMSKPAVRLCQSYNGEPVTPNCYHQVVELGEELGIRKNNPILATDRHSPKIEGAQIRFDQHTTAGTIVTEREATGIPIDARGEVTQSEHPSTGKSIPMTPPDGEIDPAITEAEKGKGIINPHSADQKPLVDPASPEGIALADAAAQEEARKIAAPVGMSPRNNPEGQTVDFPAPSENAPISPSDMVASYSEEPTSAPVIQEDKPKTPAQIALEAQAKVDEEERQKQAQARLVGTDSNFPIGNTAEPVPGVQLPTEMRAATPEEIAEIEKSIDEDGLQVAPAKKAAAKKAPAKKAAPKAAE